MPSTMYCGLYGKERVLRSRNRAFRMHERQLLDEFYDSQTDEERRDRFIPIRSRSEFLPAVSAWNADDSADDALGSVVQLELPLAGKEYHDAKNGDADALPQVKNVPAKTPFVKTDPSTTATRIVSSQPPTWAKPKASFQPVPRRSSSSFDIRKFLYGCLIGGAAASVVLLVASSLIR